MPSGGTERSAKVSQRFKKVWSFQTARIEEHSGEKRPAEFLWGRGKKGCDYDRGEDVRQEIIEPLQSN